MLNTIKQTVLETLEAMKPVAVMIGTITKTNPLEVTIDQKLRPDEDFLIVPEALAQKDLKVGDMVVLIRVQGGQQYLILDRVVRI